VDGVEEVEVELGLDVVAALRTDRALAAPATRASAATEEVAEQPAEVTEVRAHLDDCGGCEDSFVLEQRFLARVRDCCQEDVAPTELRTRIVARLRMESDRPL
jgi:mycothiol system anti-sigma-R factor